VFFPKKYLPSANILVLILRFLWASAAAQSRVARWFVFKPKIPSWVNVWEPWIGKCWYQFYDHLEHFTDTWDILWPFGTMFFHLVHFLHFWNHAPKKSGNPGAKTPRNSLAFLFSQYLKNSFPLNTLSLSLWLAVSYLKKNKTFSRINLKCPGAQQNNLFMGQLLGRASRLLINACIQTGFT
jgi:hypothetical protein